jgi:hypothetical protein
LKTSLIRIWKVSGKESTRNPGNKKFLKSHNTVERHSSTLDQVEGSISELKDKISSKKKQKNS